MQRKSLAHQQPVTMDVHCGVNDVQYLRRIYKRLREEFRASITVDAGRRIKCVVAGAAYIGTYPKGEMLSRDAEKQVEEWLRVEYDAYPVR